MTKLHMQMETVEQTRSKVSVGRMMTRHAQKLNMTLALLFAIGLSACVHTESVNDPFEPMNRKVHAFNMKFDEYLFKPVTKGYVYVTPTFVQTGVSNFFGNLTYPVVVVNQLLQGKGGLALQDTARFIVNTTVGIGGLIDVAKSMGLKAHREDFGQTFATWGVESSPYLVVPFWGPATVRDGIGDIAGSFIHPLALSEYMDERKGLRTGLLVLAAIDKRAKLLEAEKLITGDKYLFIRDAYLQHRNYLINDGVVSVDPFLDDE